MLAVTKFGGFTEDLLTNSCLVAATDSRGSRFLTAAERLWAYMQTPGSAPVSSLQSWHELASKEPQRPPVERLDANTPKRDNEEVVGLLASAKRQKVEPFVTPSAAPKSTNQKLLAIPILGLNFQGEG